MIDVASGKEGLRLAHAHFNRMIMKGVDPSLTQRVALITLMRSLEADIGLSKFSAIYPFMGGTAAAHALDLIGAYDITWSGGITHDSNGVTGDGSTGAGLVALDIQSVIGTQASCSAYIRSKGSGNDRYDIGAFASGSPSSRFYVGQIGTAFGFGAWFNVFATEVSPPNSEGTSSGARFAAGSVSGSQVSTSYFNGVAQTPGAIGTGGTSPGANIGILTIRNNSTGSFGANYSDANLAFIHFGLELDASEHLALYNAVQAYQTALGRNV